MLANCHSASSHVMNIISYCLVHITSSLFIVMYLQHITHSMTNVLNNVSIYFLITAAPVLLGKTSGSTYVTMNTNLTLTVNVSADPSPYVTWQLNGGDLAAMTTTTMR